jgi:hypothetical protein
LKVTLFKDKKMENIEIELLSKDRARLEAVEGTYWIHYNNIEMGKDSEILLTIKGSFQDQRIKAGCMSCTKAKIVSSIGETHTISIVYDSNILGPFTKTVGFFYTFEGQGEQQAQLKITGKVFR